MIADHAVYGASGAAREAGITTEASVAAARPEPTGAGERPPSLLTTLAYGMGSAVFGIKDAGFGFFLLVFYSQVIGVDATRVGAALTIALVIDAFADPIAGYWSDNFRSRWGRRHLFMYASAIPIAVSYFLLWTPPRGWSADALFWYLLVFAVATRIFLTFFETPSAAQAPELTSDYDQRSALFSYRTFFGWTGGNAMTVLMFFFLFPAFATAAIPNGQFNRGAYVVYAIVASALMFLSILISAAGTHGHIARQKQPPSRRLSLWAMLREMFETLANWSFLSVFVTAMFAFVAGGMGSALSVYFSSYFWALTSQQIALVTLVIFASALAGAALAPVATKAWGKKRGAIIIGCIGVAVSPLAVLLKLFGVLSTGADPVTFWVFLTIGQVDVALTVCLQVLLASMIADLVEQSQLKTGRRSEGVFFAANTFIQKMTSGLGVMAATLVLTLAHFPTGAQPSEVPDSVLRSLGWWFVPAVILLRLAMVGAMFTYSLDRRTHEENLRKLAGVDSGA